MFHLFPFSPSRSPARLARRYRRTPVASSPEPEDQSTLPQPPRSLSKLLSLPDSLASCGRAMLHRNCRATGAKPMHVVVTMRRTDVTPVRGLFPTRADRLHRLSHSSIATLHCDQRPREDRVKAASAPSPGIDEQVAGRSTACSHRHRNPTSAMCGRDLVMSRRR